MVATATATETATTNRVRWHALPKQMEFLRLTERQQLFSGAWGAGKSLAICLKLLARASTPGSREALIRKHLVRLRETTLRTLLEGDGELPPVLPEGSYQEHKGEKRIKLNGGGEIQYLGVADVMKGGMGSYNFTGAAVDEATDLSASEWDWVISRVRLNVRDMPRCVYGACNPAHPAHHLAVRFGLSLDHRCQPNHAAIRTKSTDNWLLPADYLEWLNSLTGWRRMRYVEGLWVGAEGLVYDDWNRTIHVKEKEGPWAWVALGVDFGYRNPSVCLPIGFDSDNRAHVITEFYKRGIHDAAFVQEILLLQQRFNARACYADPSNPELIDVMRQAGIRAKKANNAEEFGIGRVRNALQVQGDGRVRLTVHPHCENTIREFETYSNTPDMTEGPRADKPIKEFDHAMDALRYVLASYKTPSKDSPSVRVYGGMGQALRLMGGDRRRR